MSFKGVLLAVGGVLALAAGRADAAFIFQTQRTLIFAGAFAGLERVNLVLQGDAFTDPLTIGTVSIDTSAFGSGSNALKFHVPSIGNPDVYAPTDLSDVLADALNLGDKGSFAGLAGGTNLATPQANAANKPAYDAGLDTYQVFGFYPTPVTISRADAPRGIVIASAVVPAGTQVVFQGTVDNDLDELNGRTPFVTGLPVPEPAGLAGLGVVGAAMLGRRHRLPNR